MLEYIKGNSETSRLLEGDLRLPFLFSKINSIQIENYSEIQMYTESTVVLKHQPLLFIVNGCNGGFKAFIRLFITLDSNILLNILYNRVFHFAHVFEYI